MSLNTVNQSQWRSYFLAVMAIGTNLVIAYTLINPTAGNRPVANFRFPQHIKLDSVKAIALLDSKDRIEPSVDPSATIEVKQEKIKARQTYEYTHQKSQISLEMSYLVDTRGDVGAYLHQYTKIPTEAIDTKQIEEIPGIGHHTLLTNGDRAYLSSCISPRSPSNVTQKQFSQYRYQHDLKLTIAWEWLQGKASIRDRRCLWIQLSTPLVGDRQAAYQTLETTWKDVYRWWLPNFPTLTN
ncbi:cyanoexosortase A system-associated protein [Waterburya agarophytonicola K14]|uniref:Cyanoexosortase A system-associated protein n=1 Tax=Waterburya agarophytonicola KI4 TaxID=2874699 RepID=A0A964BPH7_9CYAN|nr:cyanoexosortase A system-associated protein [Waterburya agarophytonicola]MCC0176482.1 cyanoexosortase A system-associated protein [Waterburya agarophytonicola KI4]